ncbi:MAG: hypothetical protein ACRDD1_00975, partial [Planctomycetia bacterium]
MRAPPAPPFRGVDPLEPTPLPHRPFGPAKHFGDFGRAVPFLPGAGRRDPGHDGFQLGDAGVHPG